MSLFKSAKDRTVSIIGEIILNFIGEDIGKIHRLEIDSAVKKISLSLQLKGESEPVVINITRYEIIKEEGALCFKIKELNISKEWMDALFSKLLKDKAIEIPHKYAGILKIII